MKPQKATFLFSISSCAGKIAFLRIMIQIVTGL